MRHRGLKCPSRKDAKKILINRANQAKRLREESEALTTDAVFNWERSDSDEEEDAAVPVPTTKAEFGRVEAEYSISLEESCNTPIESDTAEEKFVYSTEGALKTFEYRVSRGSREDMLEAL